MMTRLMIRSATSFAVGLLISLVLSGCTAFELRDANAQLTGYYNAKQQAKAARENDWRMLETVNSSLAELAAESAAQARKEGNVLNKISFYRVAATAAWQAGIKEVVSYASEGSRLCGQENFNRAPRDCAMLVVIPVFAGVDATTEKFNSVQTEVSAAQSADQRKHFIDDAESIFNAYRDSLAWILAERPNLARAAAPPELLEAVDRNSGKLLCTQLEGEAVGLVANVRGDVEGARCDIYRLKKAAVEVGLPLSSADCLPASLATLGEPPADCDVN